jgi:hypothetical protein
MVKSGDAKPVVRNMNLDDLCTTCNRKEEYPRGQNTTYICSRCTQIMVGSQKGMAERLEKQKVASRRNKRARRVKTWT